MQELAWSGAILLVVLSSIAWLFVAFIKTDLHIGVRLILAVIGAVALIVAMQRDLYLPFLGEMALPAQLLNPMPTRGNVSMILRNVPKNAKIVYWAALPGNRASNENNGPVEAYGEYVNGGIVSAGGDGTATLTFDCPQSYTVNRLGFDKVLPKHVHYRYEVQGKNGMMSRIHTQNVTCDM